MLNESVPEVSQTEIDDLKKESEDLEAQFAKDRSKFEIWWKKFQGVIENDIQETDILKFKLKEKEHE